jgi:hypothetical protein
MCIDVLYGDVLSRRRFECATYIRCSSDAWYMYSTLYIKYGNALKEVFPGPVGCVFIYRDKIGF